jgi:hypothetical protein
MKENIDEQFWKQVRICIITIMHLCNKAILLDLYS